MPRRAGKSKPTEAVTGKRYPLNMRTTYEVRTQLEDASKDSGRSLAQEAEIRLEQSFRNQRLIHEVLELIYGQKLAGILLIIGDAMKTAFEYSTFKVTGGVFTDQSWSDPTIYDQALKAADHVLQAFRPPGDPDISKLRAPNLPAELSILQKALEQEPGPSLAEGLLQQVAGLMDLGRPLVAVERDLIGDMVERLVQARTGEGNEGSHS